MVDPKEDPKEKKEVKSRTNGDQNASSGGQQCALSHPEEMEVADCLKTESPSICSSMLAHMAPASYTDLQGSHCLVSHTATSSQQTPTVVSREVTKNRVFCLTRSVFLEYFLIGTSYGSDFCMSVKI